MASTKFGETLENVWADFVHCDAISTETKEGLNSDRRLALIGISASAVFGLLAAGHVAPLACTVLTALTAALGFLFSGKSMNTGQEHEWVLTRAIAETAKSEAYRFLTRSKPYDNADPAVNEETLGNNAAEYREKIPAGYAPPSGEAQRLSGLPTDWLTMDEYLARRVKDQIAYYRAKSLYHHKAAKLGKSFTLALGAASMGLGSIHIGESLASAAPWMALLPSASWIPVIASISGAVTTYHFQNRFHFVAQIFEMSAKRLERVLEAWGRVPAQQKPARQSEFINKFEEILTYENKQWVGEFDKSLQAEAPVEAANAHEAAAHTATPGPAARGE